MKNELEVSKRKHEDENAEGGEKVVSKYFKQDGSTVRSQSMNALQNKNSKLSREDFSKDGIALSKFLLGKILNKRDSDGDFMLQGRIVETEAYLGVTDKACHSYGAKKTNRTLSMFMADGTSYVYSIYGMYYCFNISSSDEGGCTLIRALEPLNGIEEMTCNRKNGKKSRAKSLKVRDLCSGPSKLCQAMNISKQNCNGIDMTTSDLFYVTDDDNYVVDNADIVCCKRIGIEGYGEEAARKLYRFYVKGNEHVSVKDKSAERNLESSTNL